MSLRIVCALLVFALAGLALAQDPPPPADPAPKAVTPPPPPSTVKIIINTTPRKRAWVFHGRKKLGFTPLELELPYDSGPRDIVVKTKGFITVNTRIYTLKNEKVIVSITREEDAHELFGYREKIPPDAGLSDSPDAGVDAGPEPTAPPATPPTPPAVAPSSPAPAAD